MSKLDNEDIVVAITYSEKDHCAETMIDPERLRELPTATVSSIMKTLDALRHEMMSVITDGKVNSTSSQIVDIRMSKQGFEIGYSMPVVDNMDSKQFSGMIGSLKEIIRVLIERREDNSGGVKFKGIDIIN
jgi:hypothetical protein